MNVEGISERADVAGGLKDEGRDMTACEGGDAADHERKGRTAQTLSEFIAERTAGEDADLVRRDVELIDREVERIERRFGRSEPVVLVALYAAHDKYDRILAVIDQLDMEELLAVARVLIHHLYGSELHEQGPYSDKDSFECLGGVWYSLDRLTKRLGYLLGAGDDEEAFDVGAAAIEDRWEIVIDALQAHFVTDFAVLWEMEDGYRDGWKANYDPLDLPENAITAAVYECGDDLSAARDYYKVPPMTREEARQKQTWHRLGRFDFGKGPHDNKDCPRHLR